MEAQLAVERGPGGRRSVALRPGAPCVVGRDAGAQLRLDDASVAPRHVAVSFDGRGVWVTDLAGGARLDGAPLPAGAPVEAFGGDALEVGAFALRLTLLGRGARTRARAASAPRAADPAIPADELEVLRVLGEGATGVVYAARWRPHGRVVAVKVLRDTIDPAQPDFQRFVREASTAARLRCPFIVATYDLRVRGGRAFSILELVEGPSARDLVARGPVDLATALRVGEHVARALAAAAAAGVVHRDVKPANVVLAADGTARLCDFGIAKDLEATARSLTLSGVGLGTMAYMAPEQVGGAKHVEPSADVYALGATLYHLLAGRPPFQVTSYEALAEVIERPPPPLAPLRPDAPPALVDLVHAMLAKDPDARPPAWRVVKLLAAMRGVAAG